MVNKEDIYDVDIHRISDNPVETMISAAALAAGVSASSVRSPTRVSGACLARRLISYELKQRGHTYSQIGSILNRDHTTIMHHYREMEYRLGRGFRLEQYAYNWFKKLLESSNDDN